MNRLIVLTLSITCLVSCQKQFNQNDDQQLYMNKVKAAMRDSVSTSDYTSLDFSKAVLSIVDSVQLYLLRIPFKGKNIKNDFVMVKTSGDGKVEKGKIIHMEGSETEFGEGKIKKRKWDGNISITSLNRKAVLNSSITNGYVDAFHIGTDSRTTLVLPPYVLSEVIVIGYIHNSGMSFSDLMLLQSFFNDYGSGGSSYGGYYGSMDGIGGGGLGYGSGNPLGGGGSLPQDPLLEIEQEYIYNILSVNINKLFKCFDYVPSNGATYSIKLCSDIPSNNNPNVSANFSNASGGHSFLIVTKTNGTNTVTQSFGFYPLSTPPWYDPFAPVTSTLKDNGLQEINASIEMNISEGQFNTVKQNAISWSSKQYELADYNCTSYALDIYNSVRAIPITISPYVIYLPGNTNAYNPAAADPVTVTINKSPQELFIKLRDMKNSNDPEASHIAVDQSHNSHAPISKGECN